MYKKYDPGHMSGQLPVGLEVRVADKKDVMEIAEISAERNGTDIKLSVQIISKQFENLQARDDFKFFAASVNSKVVGFARCSYIDTNIKPLKFPSPSGWYGLGLIVKNEFRGQGIARSLSDYRIQWLKTRTKAEYLYSFASAENTVSLKMHKEFGFEEIMTGPGFLDVSFECGKGSLFRIKIR